MTFFFFFFTFYFFSRSASECQMGLFSMIANYYHWNYHQLFLLHYHCFSIIIAVYSKIWGRLVRSRSEYFQYRVRFYGDHAIDLCRKLVGCFLVYAGSTWYISDEKLVFLNNFPWFRQDSINNNGRHSIIQKFNKILRLFCEKK